MSGLQSKRNINKSQNLLLRWANNMLFDSVLVGTLILEWHFWSLPQVTNRRTAVTGTSFVFCLQMLLLGFADHHFSSFVKDEDSPDEEDYCIPDTLEVETQMWRWVRSGSKVGKAKIYRICFATLSLTTVQYFCVCAWSIFYVWII